MKKEAQFYNRTDRDNVECRLCPINCIIKNNETGNCRVRTNNEGVLVSESYGVISSIGFDPIEKKPLYHFYPGSEILSIGSFGCNLKCQFCQNWEISQSSVKDYNKEHCNYKPEDVIDLAFSNEKNIGIAYTYNEPAVFIEFVLDTAKIAKVQGLKNVMVTNGFINQEPLNELNKYIDAYNVDIKSFNDLFYKKYTKSFLEPVKDVLKNIVKAGKHIEITNLIIPGLNDNLVEFEEMLKWINLILGEDAIIHISRYHPMFKLSIPATPSEKMIEFYYIAKKYVKYVYLGNINLPEGRNTYCPYCNELLIRRDGYKVSAETVDSNGDCISCGSHLLNFIR